MDCGNHKLVPGLAVLRPATASRLAARRARHYGPASEVALVVEVESPPTRLNDRNAKHTIYAQAGIENYWRIERAEPGRVGSGHRGA
ncbi:MAG: Uma2 family endonuclease [Mycobacteriales bacterium]